MKTVKHIIAICFVLGMLSCKNHESNSTPSNTEIINGVMTSTFTVWGNCEMCKETIEGSLKVDGVITSNWNQDTKMISVSYDSSKVSLDEIQKKIAAAGYDNEKYKANDDAYKSLPECCQYARKP